MKVVLRLSLLLVLFVMMSFRLEASHAMGADLTFQCLGPNQYTVTLTFFRDCDGITPLSSYPVSFSSATCGVSSTITVNQVGAPIDITPLCAGQQSSCTGNGTYGVEQYTYQGTLTLPPGCGNDWVLSWTECCRNFAISTLVNPGNHDFYVEAHLDNTLPNCDNSPAYNNPPVAFVCDGQMVNFNHGVVDPDGDSLVFSLVNCQQNASTSVNYAPPYSGVNPINTGGGIMLNSQTGDITFTPAGTQVGVICVLVEEFRNGVKIGEVVRDMQFTVISCMNTLPTATGVNGTGIFQYDMCVGNTYCFDILSNDVDAGQNLTMAWNMGIPTGTFTVAGNNGPSPTGTFCWTPSATDIGVHYFTVTITDDACPINGSNTYSYQVDVLPLPPAADAGPDVTICLGDSTQLMGSTAGGVVVSYQWTPTTGLSNPNSAITWAQPNTTTVYQLTTTFNDGCYSTDIVTVNIDPAPIVTTYPKVHNICPGGNATLTASSTGNGLTWTWIEDPAGAANNLGSGTVTGNSSSINVSPASNTTYIVSTQSGAGCASNIDTIQVNITAPAAGSQCVNIYVSTIGTPADAGTRNNPTDLLTALSMAACNNSVIKMASGTYNFNAAISTITSSLTIEGGYNATFTTKNSLVGATTINRTNAAPFEGTATAPAMIAIDISNAANFRLQDLTITTTNAPAATGAPPVAISTYGLRVINCSNYDIVRCAILPGNGGTGSNGNNGSNGAIGSNGQNGESGSCDGTCNLLGNNCSPGGDGGAGGAGGGGAAGGALITGPGSGSSNGLPGALSANARNGGGGGSGGTGGHEDSGPSNGGDGGNGGGVNTVVGANTTIGNGAAGGCPFGFDGTNGANGVNGANGMSGVAGAAGMITGNLYAPGGFGGNGSDGEGGQGGAGGGGGGAQRGFTCDNGEGNGGGGGGGGGQGGTGGTGGSGGGASVGILIASNGAGGNIVDCNINAGGAGAGGNGGSGGNGGNGGNGGFGPFTCVVEVGAGGDGGNGGNGGDGGNGGNGAPGIAQNVEFVGGAPLNNNINNFNLAAQPVIDAENISCTNLDIDFSGPANNTWNLGLGAMPVAPMGVLVTTQYTSIGRKDIVYNTDTYTGFHLISIAQNIVPQISTTANVFSGDTFYVCQGETANFLSNIIAALNYDWDFNGATVPSAYVSDTADVLLNIAFNTSGTFLITHRVETDCCGWSERDSIYLLVEPQPLVSISGNTTICEGSNTTLTATGAASYLWTPSTGINNDTSSVVIASPITTTTYTVSGTSPNGLCVHDTSVTVTVVPALSLSSSAVDVTCNNNGQASVVVNNGTGPFNYVWSNGMAGVGVNNITGLAPGVYNVVVTDQANGCMDSVSITVGVNPMSPIAFVVMSANPTCPQANDGFANGQAIAGFGAAPYTLNWYDGTGMLLAGNQANLNALAGGTYVLEVVDNLGCTSTDTIVLIEPDTILINVLNQTDISCIGASDGSLLLNASGGNGPYSFGWSHNALNDSTFAGNLDVGNYTFYVTDQNGCIDSATFTITGPGNLNPTITLSDDTLCIGENVTLTYTGGGSLGVNYTWSFNGGNAVNNGADVRGPYDINWSIAGNYTIQLTIDSNGCMVDSTIDVVVVPLPDASIIADGPYCVNSPQDTLMAAVTAGGVWSGTGIVNSIPLGGVFNPATAGVGMHWVYYQVTDANNCTSIDSFQVTVNALPPAPSLSNDTAYCLGSAISQINSSSTGGTISWYLSPTLAMPMGAGATFDPSPFIGGTGLFTFYAQESLNGCLGPYDSVNISIIPVPALVTKSNDTVLCDGSIAANLNANFTVGSISWYADAALTTLLSSGSSFNPNPFIAGTGNFVFYVAADTVTCFSTVDSVQVTVLAPLNIAVQNNDTAICQNSFMPNLTANAAAGNISWSQNNAFGPIIGTGSIFNANAFIGVAGVYTFYARADTLGCLSNYDSVNITVNAAPPIPAGSPNVSYCLGDAIANLTAVGTGGTLNWYTNVPIGASVATGSNFDPTPFIAGAGVYNFYVAEELNNCFSVPDTITVTIIATPPPPTLTNDTFICLGSSLTLTASGTGGTLNWYTNNTLTVPINTGATYMPFFVAPGSSTLWVTETIGNCVSLPDSVTVTVFPTPPQPTGTGGATYCQGDAINNLSALVWTNTPGNILQWFNNPNLLIPVGTGTSFNPFPFLGGPGTYTFYLTEFDGTCNSTADAISITINPLPASPVVVDDTFCFGDIISTMTPANPNGHVLNWYDADPANGGATLLVTGPSYQPPSASGIDTVFVTATDANLCTSPAAMALTHVLALPPADAGPDTAVCEGFSVIIGGNPSANPGDIASWTCVPPIGVTFLSDDSAYNPTVNAPPGTGGSNLVYTLTVDDGSCVSTDVMIVNVVAQPNPTFTGLHPSYCLNEIGDTLMGLPTGGQFTLLGYGILVNDYFNPSIVDSAGTYEVVYTYSNAANCINSDTQSVIIAPIPSPTFSIPTRVCPSDTVMALYVGGSNIDTFNWSFTGEDFVSGNQAGPYFIVWDDLGTYSVSLQVISNNGCVADTTITVTVSGPTVTTIPDETIDFGDEIQLFTSTMPILEPTLTYNWYSSPLNAPLSCYDCPHPFATPSETTTYYVEVTDSNGCVGLDSVVIEVFVDKSLYIPNAFTPNDDGNNDFWQVYGRGFADIEIMVFNRWGEKVFEADATNQPWDGTFKGKPLNPGIFIFMVRGTYNDGKSVERKGNITLLK